MCPCFQLKTSSVVHEKIMRMHSDLGPAKQKIIAYQKYLHSRFSWSPAKLEMSVLWLVVYFLLLSENICQAKFSA